MLFLADVFPNQEGGMIHTRRVEMALEISQTHTHTLGWIPSRFFSKTSESVLVTRTTIIVAALEIPRCPCIDISFSWTHGAAFVLSPLSSKIGSEVLPIMCVACYACHTYGNNTAAGQLHAFFRNFGKGWRGGNEVPYCSPTPVRSLGVHPLGSVWGGVHVQPS